MRHAATRLTAFATAILIGVAPVRAQLSGTLTIGTAPSDYATIGAAVADLVAVGISDDLTFEIKNGTYDEQVTVSWFPRSGDADDAVTFKPVGGASVTWQYSGAGSTTNWVVKVDSASYVRFLNIDFVAAAATYGRLILIENGSFSIRVNSCTLTGIFASSTITGTLAEIDGTGGGPSITDVRFRKNTFALGHRGISTKTYASGTEAYGNTFNAQFDAAIYLDAAVGSVVDSNFVTDASYSDSGYLGIFVNGAATITRNVIDQQKGETGIWLFSTEIGGIGSTKTIVNNMVALRSATALRGIYATANSVDLYHNTVRMDKGGRAVYVADREGINIWNNVLVNDGGGFALESPFAGAIQSSDYNILYSSGAHPVHWEGTDYTNLSDYRQDSGRDLFSFASAVTFVDTTGPDDLHLASPSDTDVNLVAPEVAGITTDIDNDARGNYTVTRGADEGIQQLPLDNADTGSGFYTVGGSSPDFAHPMEATKHLDLRGIKGNVTFQIRPGTYQMHRLIQFTNHSGAAASAKTATSSDTVLFRASDPSNRPTLEHAATSSTDNWIVKVVNADMVRFRNINFTANGTPPYGRVFELVGDVDDFAVAQCSITGLPGETSWAANLIHSTEFEQDRLAVQRCTLTGGAYGIYFKTTGVGTQGEYSSIRFNYFDDQTLAGMIIDHAHTLIEGDTVVTGRDDAIGIHLSHAWRPRVINNATRIFGENTIGLLLENTNGLVNNLSLVANNFLNARGTGLKLISKARLHAFYNNTIRGADYATFLDPTAGADSDSTLYFVNNIMVNTTTEPAFYVPVGTDIAVSDFNNLTNDGGGTLVHWDGSNYGTLAAYQSAVGLDLNSVSTAVTFVDQVNADLHLTGPSDGDGDLAGTPLDSVTTDIDGDARSPISPYMGADEATTPLALALMLDLDVFLEGPYGAGSMSTNLNSGGHLAAGASAQPFNTSPWNYAGSETIDGSFLASNPNVVDWVLVTLYNGTLPSVSPVGSVAALVLSDGSVVSHSDGTADPAFNIVSGSYYVGVFHRNHLGIISASKIDFALPSPSYDFTTASAQAYGTSPMADLSGNWGMFAADDNADGQVTATDFNSWLTDTKAAATGYLSSDFNLDGQVTANDFNVWLTNTKAAASSQVP